VNPAEVLDLAHVEMGKTGVLTVAPILRSRASRTFSTLRCNGANLSEFGSTMDPVRELCHALQGHAGITHLDMSHNMMTRTGELAFMAATGQADPHTRMLHATCRSRKSLPQYSAIVSLYRTRSWQ